MNAANVITIVRIPLIPVFVVLLFSNLPHGDALAAAVFIVAASTDTLDGYVARARNSVTTFGQFVDPLADKLLVTAALVSLVGLGRVPAWVAMVILGREFAVSALRVVGLAQGVSIPAAGLGKIKTVFQCVYIGFVLLPHDSLAGFLHVHGGGLDAAEWSLLLITVALTVVSGVRYFVNARNVIRLPGSVVR